MTILVTDLSGFRNFVEVAEPEVVVSALREMHVVLAEAADRHGGVVFDWAGDSAFLMFNDPMPVSDPEIRAVRAAVDLRDRFRSVCERWQRTHGARMTMDIGIHTGFATVGMMGPPGKERYGPVGRTIVLAVLCAREAKPGQVVVTQRVAGSVEQVAELAPLPDLDGGLDRPARIFKVLGLRDSVLHRAGGEAT